MVLVRTASVALVGNPNTGKTTLFNALAGMRQRVGNYPGVTVEIKKGKLRYRGQTLDLVDLPGTYSLAPRSPDELLCVDLVLGQHPQEPRPDIIISIVDASNLERNLYLTTQTFEIGVPVIVALNMIDVAEGQGLRIDVDRLSRQLGVPVVPVQANSGRGLEELKQKIVQALESAKPPSRTVCFPQVVEEAVTAFLSELPDVPTYLVRRLLLDSGGFLEKQLGQRYGEEVSAQLHQVRRRLEAGGLGRASLEARQRYGWIGEAVQGCLERPAERRIAWTDRLDRIFTHRLWGTLLFLGIMFVVFQSIFTWARPIMGWIGDGKDALAGMARDFLPAGPLSSLLIDGGLEGVGSVVVFLPQILILFGFIAILEDCGYMARAAFLMDKLMSRCGLSGKSFIPLLSSMACAVPGIMATRVIENRRDRLATILVAPLMSCSARLPVYVLLIGAFLTEGFAWWLPGLVMFFAYSLGLVLAPLVAYVLKRSLLRGETPAFVMEMPLYKWPSWKNVTRRMMDSGWAFLRRAGTLIFAAMILVWALLYFPRGDMNGQPYDVQLARLQEHLESLQNQSAASSGPEHEILARNLDEVQTEIDQVHGVWKRQSILGRMGRVIEPAVRPLGWDWRVGMAALASFPAREVVVGTLGIIYNQGKVDTEAIRNAPRPGETKLGRALQEATWENEPGRRVFTVPTALSLLVFFALCCQCVSTLAVIRRETASWKWPVLTFAYMTVLAYLGALLTYQLGTWLS
jgi:ferrous iron transport protein B